MERPAPFADLGTAIGLFGGSFDPVQAAHLATAERAREHFGLGGVVFIPQWQNPLKAERATAAEHRVAMLQIALRHTPQFRLSRLEVDSGASCYTIDTVRAVRRLVGTEPTLYWIIGSEIWPQLHRWRAIHELLSEAVFITVTRTVGPERPAAEVTTELSAAECALLDRYRLHLPPIDISSTAVREAVRGGRVPHEWLPPGVGDYITAHGLDL